MIGRIVKPQGLGLVEVIVLLISSLIIMGRLSDKTKVKKRRHMRKKGGQKLICCKNEK